MVWSGSHSTSSAEAANDGWWCTSACMCANNAFLRLHPKGRPLLFQACLFCPPPFSRIARWSHACKFDKSYFAFSFPPFHFTYCTLSLSVFFPGKHYDGVVIGKTLWCCCRMPLQCCKALVTKQLGVNVGVISNDGQAESSLQNFTVDGVLLYRCSSFCFLQLPTAYVTEHLKFVCLSHTHN